MQKVSQIKIPCTIMLTMIWLSVLQPCLFSQDLTLHQMTTTSPKGVGNDDGPSTIYVSTKAMKIARINGNDMIIDFEAGRMLTIDHKNKTYNETTREQMQHQAEQASERLAKNKEAAEAMKKMMGSMAMTVAREGAGETIAGFRTEKYAVKGFMNMEIWAAPDLKIPASYYDSYKFLISAMPMFDVGKMIDELKKIDGAGLKTVMAFGQMGTKTTVVTSVDKSPLPASTFAIPAGYKLAAK